MKTALICDMELADLQWISERASPLLDTLKQPACNDAWVELFLYWLAILDEISERKK